MKSLLSCIFALAILISVINSQCIIKDPSPITLDNGVAVVCLHLKQNGVYNSTYAFRIKVDYFDALVVNGLAGYINGLIKSNTLQNMSIQVQFQNSQFTGENNQVKEIQIYDKPGLRYRDIASFIILTNEGGFTQIRLDNQKCDTLGGDQLCYNDQAYTKANADGTIGTADPRFFVSWMGTDVNKNHFISHTRRLSRFSAFSVGSIYQDAKNVVNA